MKKKNQIQKDPKQKIAIKKWIKFDIKIK